MSHISYAFNHSDIEATAYALTVLPRLGLAESEAQAEINYQLCCSAAKKLINHATDITPDEFRTIIAALQAAKLIILGDIEVDAKTCSECKSYFFTINKLLSIFEKQLLQETGKCSRQRLKQSLLQKNFVSFTRILTCRQPSVLRSQTWKL